MKREELPDWLADWQARLDYIIIKNAQKQGKIYDIDRLFWNDGKLFGCDTFYKEIGGFELGPYFSILKDDEEYDIEFHFDWERYILELSCRDFNPYIAEPVFARVSIAFEQLFGVNPGVAKVLIRTNAERLIKEIEILKNNDKKGNRDC